MNLIKLVAFDVDGVFLEEKSSWGFISKQLGIKDTTFVYYNMYLSGKIDYYDWMYIDTFTWIKNSKKEKIYKADIEAIFKKVKVNEEMVEVAKMLESIGKKVVLLSGGIDVFVKNVAQRIGEKTIWLSNKLVFNEQDELVPGGIPLVPAGSKGKILYNIMEKYNLVPSEVAYVGDEVWDLEAFEASGLAILYNFPKNGLPEIIKRLKKSSCALVYSPREILNTIEKYEKGQLKCFSN